MSNLLSGSFPTKSYRNLDLGVTGQVIKVGHGEIFEYHLTNNAAAARFVKLYDKATAPTGADTPIRTIQLAASAGITLSVPDGIEFLSGISIRGTVLIADNDASAPTANDIVVNIGYK
jgi:hypothetical protein